ncbi:hypothetical protein ABZ907_08675 [Nonomuraea wenchangensis]
MSVRRSAVSCLMLAAALPAAPAPASADDGPVYLAAGLRGANEAGVPGDPDGQATLVLRIALLAEPSAFHAGVRDARGSVRGRLHRLSRPVDLNGVLNGPDQAALAAATTPQGRATWWLRPAGPALAYAASWSGAPTPVTGGLVAREGVTRPAVATLFAGALPENVTGVSGVTPVPPEVLRRIAAAPARYARPRGCSRGPSRSCGSTPRAARPRRGPASPERRSGRRTAPTTSS